MSPDVGHQLVSLRASRVVYSTIRLSREVRLSGLTIWGAKSFGDPLFDVAGSVSDVLTDSEPGWAGAFVPPGVQRGDGHCQVLGQLPGREKTFEGIHHPIVSNGPVIRVLSGCQSECSPGASGIR
jgi:hypothetical protein